MTGKNSKAVEIIPYNKANAKLQARMDRIIDAMTDSFDAVINYGMSAVKNQRDLAKELSKPDSLNACVKNMDKHIGNAKQFNKAARLEMTSAIKETRKLDAARRACTRELGAYIGAAQEILKRKIVANQEKHFSDAVYVLEGMHKLSISMEQQIQLTAEARKNQIKIYKKLFGNFNKP